MDRAGIERMLTEAYAARRRDDVDGVLAHFADDATFRIVAGERLGDFGRQVEGLAAIGAAFAQLFPAWDWQDCPTESMTIDTEARPVRAVVHTAGTMRHVPSGERFACEVLDLITFDDGKIASLVEFTDTSQIAHLMSEG